MGVQHDGATLLADRCELEWRHLVEGPRPRQVEVNKVSPTWHRSRGPKFEWSEPRNKA